MQWFTGRRKKKKNEEPTVLSPAEQLLLLKEEKKTELNQLSHQFERKVRGIKETYQKRTEAANLTEKNLSFQTILFEADSGKHPLIYVITRSNPHAQYYLLSRGDFTPNPYKVEITNHKNVVFLKGYEADQTEVPLFFLHYDKINATYSEYGWRLSCDYVEKYQIKQFLFDLMKAANDNRMELHPKIKSHHEAYFAFERSLTGESFQWKSELQAELQAVAAEKKMQIDQLNETYRVKALGYEEAVEKKKKEKQMLAQQERLKREEEGAGIGLSSGTHGSVLRLNREGRVYNQETHRAMNALFQRVYGLLQYEQLLDVYAQHDLASLYQKDIHELWYGFIKLDKKAQEKEDLRFMRILGKIHLRLDAIEEKLEKTHSVDYEKKIAFLEKKYT